VWGRSPTHGCCYNCTGLPFAGDCAKYYIHFSPDSHSASHSSSCDPSLSLFGEGGGHHVKKSAVDEEKHLTRHAVSNQDEVVEGVDVQVIAHLRQIDEAEGEDDPEDAIHHVDGAAVLGPGAAAELGRLLFVPLFTTILFR